VSPELWRGEHDHPEDLVTDMCDALLITVGLDAAGDPRSPTARGAVRTNAVRILDKLADYGWQVTREPGASR
jgi:hypothetical protein